MAGRGRGARGGRGRGLGFNLETYGFGRGQPPPPCTSEPQPVYPHNDVKAVPLMTDKKYDYLLVLKQEYRANMKESVYYIKPDDKRIDIERYTVKYQQAQQALHKQGCMIWSTLPKELHPTTRKRKVVKKSKAKPKQDADVLKKLEELEQKEGGETEPAEEEDAEEEDEPDAKKRKEGEEEEEEVEEEVNEDELEDETDYAMNYFDNGENFGADEDDDLEEDARDYY